MELHDVTQKAAAAIAISPDDVAAVNASCRSMAALHDDVFVDQWINKSRKTATLNTMLVALDEVNGWGRSVGNGNINHDNGRFFSIIGVHVRHRVDRDELEWDQPIIEQPETGILGILAREINGLLHFCLQAKEEPGNIGNIQLSPTVQATYSNYTGAHGGATPQFLELFSGPRRARILFARLQTEDGGRFLYKSNRNMIAVAADDFPQELPEGFIWLTMRQIMRLMNQDNLVNACSRSILSSLAFAVVQEVGEQPHTPCHELEAGIRSTLQWLDDRRAANHMLTQRIGLNDLQEWHIDGKGFFSHQEQRFFRIVGLQVSSGTREVRRWGQPIIENPAAGIIGLLVRHGADGLELLMQAKAEVGNRSTVQLGPTVQFTQGNYEGSRKLKKPFLYDEFLEPNRYRLLHESRQTEEGARFYREYHLHRILLLPEGMSPEPPTDYAWLSLEQVMFLVHLGEQVNSCARSILTCLLCRDNP
ncbi:MAG: NDP-hexose 2,3-dehydratase family protein [Desulfuromonadaceae bacterium]|nr:NDP-hexose 2,3-dehydratase family protein [Desulfuromonadaceae bacterium]